MRRLSYAVFASACLIGTVRGCPPDDESTGRRLFKSVPYNFRFILRRPKGCTALSTASSTTMSPCVLNQSDVWTGMRSGARALCHVLFKQPPLIAPVPRLQCDHVKCVSHTHKLVYKHIYIYTYGAHMYHMFMYMYMLYACVYVYVYRIRVRIRVCKA